MGGGESRPIFPSDQQWKDYVKSRGEENKQIVKQLQDFEEKKNKNLEKLEETFVQDVVEYMKECQDKSLFKKTFFCNDGCTAAKEKLLITGMQIVNSKQMSVVANRALKKVQNKF